MEHFALNSQICPSGVGRKQNQKRLEWRKKDRCATLGSTHELVSRSFISPTAEKVMMLQLDTQARAGGLKEKLSGLDRRGKAKVSNKLAVKTRQPSKKKKKKEHSASGPGVQTVQAEVNKQSRQWTAQQSGKSR